MATATKDQMVRDPQNSSVRVEIFDQAYNLRGSDPEYILKLAEYVDAKMRAVAEATNTIDTVRLAVLAALNIADEYHLLKKRQDTGATDYLKRAHLLANALDEVPLREAPITYPVAQETARVQFPHRDPADRFLVATERVFGLTLVTAEEQLLKARQSPVLANR